MGMLEGRVAIVTGASSGIGRSCARKFAEEGAAVVGCARRLDNLQELVREVESRGGRALAVECDIGREDDIERVVSTAAETFGRIDILANIAQGGLDDLTDICHATPERVLHSFTTGPLQTLLFMQKCFPYMKRQGYGRIINASSGSCTRGVPGTTAYGMAKGAIMALTRNASQEWGQFGIVTNTFLPVIITETIREGGGLRDREEEIAAQAPLRRIGRPDEDCAPVLAFLASEGAGYVNGQSIAIDGGLQLLV